MKVKKVSALRRKRGLLRVNGAEPPVVGRPPRPIPRPPDGALFAQSVAMGLTIIASRPFDQHNFGRGAHGAARPSRWPFPASRRGRDGALRRPPARAFLSPAGRLLKHSAGQ